MEISLHTTVLLKELDTEPRAILAADLQAFKSAATSRRLDILNIYQ